MPRLKRALTLGIPIYLGYIPVAFTFGALCAQLGMPFLQVLGFAALLYSGSGQFLVLGMITAQVATVFSVFLSVTLVTVRHVLFTTSFLPKTKKWTVTQKLRFFPLLTDENFAVLMTQRQVSEDPNFSFTMSFSTYLVWVVSTVFGYLLGANLPNGKSIGLDFALVGLFIGILSLFVKRKEHVVTVGALVGVAVVFRLSGVGAVFGRTEMLIQSLIASAVGWRFGWKMKSGLS